jgi:hypothetical protein
VSCASGLPQQGLRLEHGEGRGVLASEDRSSLSGLQVGPFTGTGSGRDCLHQVRNDKARLHELETRPSYMLLGVPVESGPFAYTIQGSHSLAMKARWAPVGRTSSNSRRCRRVSEHP